MIKAVFTAIALTLAAVVVFMNFVTPQKQLERKLPHIYAVADEQFRREMSVMLGPTIVAGNSVKVLQNGKEIFSVMLGAIRSARGTICFET